MNREIKFRAWDLDNKKYEYDIAIKPVNRIIGVEIFNNEMYPVEFRGIVEQYTGLKDKNGKEIYEGDIVKCYSRRKLLGEYQVSWNEDCGGFECESLQAKVLGCEVLPHETNFPDPKFWKVIDNKDAAKMLQKMLDEIDGKE